MTFPWQSHLYVNGKAHDVQYFFGRFDCNALHTSLSKFCYAYPNMIIVKVVKTVDTLTGSCYLIVTERSICNCFFTSKVPFTKIFMNNSWPFTKIFMINSWQEQHSWILVYYITWHLLFSNIKDSVVTICSSLTIVQGFSHGTTFLVVLGNLNALKQIALQFKPKFWCA